MPAKPNESVYPSEILFPFAMGALLFGCFIYYTTRYFPAISLASGFASACCAFLAFLQVKNLRINLIRIQVYLSAVAYFFPLSYLGFIDNVGLLQAGDDELAACSMMIAISITIGWCFSYLVRLDAIVPSGTPSFLQLRDIILLIIPACLYQILMIVTGKWSYESTHVTFLGEGEPISPLIILSHLVFGIGALVAFNYGLLRRGERTWALAIVTFGTLALGTIFWLIESRRSMATYVLLSAVAFFLGRTKGRFSPKQIVASLLVFVVLGLGLAQAGKFFTAMREARQILGREQTRSMSILEFIEYARKLQAQPPSPVDAAAQVKRPFVIESVAIVLKYIDHNLYGKELAMQVVTNIPSFLFPGKTQFTADTGEMEDLWTKEFGVPLNDYANSFVLDGYVDFGYLGFLIYSIFAAVCVQLTYRLYSISPCLAYYCIFGNISLFLQVETSLSTYVGYFRNMLLLFIPLWIGYTFMEGIAGRSNRPLLGRPSKPRRLSSSPLDPAAIE